MKKIILAVAAAASVASTSAFALGACHGQLFNPLTDPNWDYAFPVTVAGVAVGKNVNPPLMYEPPVCVCPGHFGIPAVGIGITYWNPKYIAEMGRDPMCLSSLGAFKLTETFDMEASEQQAHSLSDSDTTHGKTARMQAHWYEYPLYALIEMFTGFCHNSSTGFNLAWMSEIDPTHQSDTWGAVFSPEAQLFANPIAQASCALDAAAAAAMWPMDPLFWCSGSWGSTYPLTGTSATNNSNQASNGLALTKFLAKQFRVGAMLATIGPQSICSSVYSPVWIKSQFRINEVYPTRVNGVLGPVYAGQTEFRWGLVPPANYPVFEASNYLIWNGQQCCLTFW